MKLQFTGTFAQALSNFVRLNQQTSEAAILCSQWAIDHYYTHGDTAYLNQFYDAMLANWNRRQAFVTWLVEHADVFYDNDLKTWKKDKGEKALIITDEIKASAFDKAFFDYAPAPMVNYYGVDEIDKAIARALRQFEPRADRKSLKPAKGEEENVVVHLNDIKRALAGKVKGVELPPAVQLSQADVPAERKGETDAETIAAEIPATVVHEEPQPIAASA